jgi:hypothetical protein
MSINIEKAVAHSGSIHFEVEVVLCQRHEPPIRQGAELATISKS